MARILLAVSSIGLGHAARSRVLGRLLEEAGHEVYYYAPGRAGWYLEAWGARLLPSSRGSLDLSLVAEKWYRRTGSALIGLRAALEEHRAALRNAELLLRDVERLAPDVVVADESWEAISVAERLPRPRVWIADFPLYPPMGGPRRVAAAAAVNRFLLRRLPLFDLLVYVGLPWPEEGLRAYRVAGPRISEVLSWFTQVGPVTPVLAGEALGRVEARRLLGLPHGARVVLAQPGGTSIGEERLPALAERAADEGWLVYRLRERNPLLPRLLRAFDCVVSNAGLSTIAALARLGVPGVVEPLPGHFEQEHNASTAPRLWPWISDSPPCPGPGPGDEWVEYNARALAREVAGA